MIKIGSYLKKCLYLLFVISFLIFVGSKVFAQNTKLFLGIKLRVEIQALADEVEQKTNKKIYAQYVEFDDENEFVLGSSYINSNGTPILSVTIDIKQQPKKVEAVVAHELLHLRLRANNYPVFLFDPKVKTKRGSAQDVEQTNVNDLTSLIEHRAFNAEMEHIGLSELINLAGDTEHQAKKRQGEVDSQADAINYARAILEYQDASDVEKLRVIYQKNKWNNSLKIGKEIAHIIKVARLSSPSDSASVFLLCVSKLYPTPRPLRLKLDKTVIAYRQMLIGL